MKVAFFCLLNINNNRIWFDTLENTQSMIKQFNNIEYKVELDSNNNVQIMVETLDTGYYNDHIEDYSDHFQESFLIFTNSKCIQGNTLDISPNSIVRFASFKLVYICSINGVIQAGTSPTGGNCIEFHYQQLWMNMIIDQPICQTRTSNFFKIDTFVAMLNHIAMKNRRKHLKNIFYNCPSAFNHLVIVKMLSQWAAFGDLINIELEHNTIKFSNQLWAITNSQSLRLVMNSIKSSVLEKPLVLYYILQYCVNIDEVGLEILLKKVDPLKLPQLQSNLGGLLTAKVFCRFSNGEPKSRRKLKFYRVLKKYGLEIDPIYFIVYDDASINDKLAVIQQTELCDGGLEKIAPLLDKLDFRIVEAIIAKGLDCLGGNIVSVMLSNFKSKKKIRLFHLLRLHAIKLTKEQAIEYLRLVNWERPEEATAIICYVRSFQVQLLQSDLNTISLILKKNNISNDLKAKLLFSFPKAGIFDNEKSLFASNYMPSVCSICLESVDSQNIKSTTSCGHTFHRDCLTTWTDHHTTCPICKAAKIATMDWK